MSPPRHDCVLVTFGRPMTGHLRRPAHPTQQQRSTLKAVPDVEHRRDERNHPDQRPSLILDITRRRRPGLQPLLQPEHLPLAQLPPGSTRSLRRQRIRPTGQPRTPPRIRRLRRHLQPHSHIDSSHTSGEQIRRLPAHPLPPLPARLGQPATIGIPHPPSISPTVHKGRCDTRDPEDSKSLAEVAVSGAVNWPDPLAPAVDPRHRRTRPVP